MLSYRHGFHAGNHADVLKHATWTFVARYMQQKDGGILFLDTHAGAGVYDLGAPEARKTGEFRQGIAPVLAQRDPPPAFVGGYAALVRAHNGDGTLRGYPGSPALAAAIARPQDRVELCELHPTDFARLQKWARGRKRIAARRLDGLKALSASLPPRERRALVLIDPSYEIKSDYDTVIAALVDAWRRFPGGVYLMWYPVIERERVDAMTATLQASPVRKLFRLELCISADSTGRGMTGSGLFVVNPPFTLPAAAATGLSWLARVLDARGPVTADWIVAEQAPADD
jgi:23S rRNA (adenine2030-N6)-methyltransferase